MKKFEQHHSVAKFERWICSLVVLISEGDLLSIQNSNSGGVHVTHFLELPQQLKEVEIAHLSLFLQQNNISLGPNIFPGGNSKLAFNTIYLFNCILSPFNLISHMSKCISGY